MDCSFSLWLLSQFFKPDVEKVWFSQLIDWLNFLYLSFNNSLLNFNDSPIGKLCLLLQKHIILHHVDYLPHLQIRHFFLFILKQSFTSINQKIFHKWLLNFLIVPQVPQELLDTPLTIRCKLHFSFFFENADWRLFSMQFLLFFSKFAQLISSYLLMFSWLLWIIKNFYQAFAFLEVGFLLHFVFEEIHVCSVS